MSKDNTEPDEAIVYFPAVNGQSAPLAKATAMVSSRTPKGGERCHCGKHITTELKLEDEATGILLDNRKHEPDRAQRSWVTSIDLKQVPEGPLLGKSYSAALMLADTLARYSALSDIDGIGPIDRDRRIVATGIIIDDKHHLQRVEQFCVKVAGVQQALDQGLLRAGDIFIYPLANQEDRCGADDKPVSEAIRALQDAGLRCVGLHRLEMTYPVYKAPRQLPWTRIFTGIGSRSRSNWTAAAVATLLFLVVAIVFCCPEPDKIVTKINPARNDSDYDIGIWYTQGGSSGRKAPLHNGDRLQSGDRFAIRIHAKRAAYLYIWHTDAGFRQVVELVGKARPELATPRRNLLQANTELELPSKDSHYKLDHNAGPEQFHTIVSSAHLADLYLRYQQLRRPTNALETLSGPALANAESTAQAALPGAPGDRSCTPTRGFEECLNTLRGFTEANNPQPPAAGTPAAFTAGSPLHCLADGDACKQSFSFMHLR